jgi:hypothetical protein
MALSFGDIALSIGAGVAEKDMAIRDAEFKQALETFKEDKAHTKKLAELRYARDLKTYDDEVAKLDNIKSAYALAEKAGPVEAGKLIAAAENPKFFETLSEDGQNDLGASIAANFKYNYKTYKEGDELPEGAKVGDRVMLNGQPIVESFSFGRKDYTLNEPKPADYYMDNKFWKDEEEKLDKSSFVTKQVRKLLGKEDKGIDATNYAEKIQNKKVNEIKTFLDDDATYTSTNLGTASVQGARLYSVSKKEQKVYDTMLNEYKESTGIATNSIKQSVIAPIVALNKNIIDNYTFEQKGGELVVSGDGQHIGQVSDRLWTAILKSKKESIEYYNIPDAKGNSNTGDFTAFDRSVYTKEYQDKWNERALFLNNKKLIGNTDLSGITLIPLDILPIQVTITEAERKQIENAVNKAIANEDGNISNNQNLIDKTIKDTLEVIANNRQTQTDSNNQSNNNNNTNTNTKVLTEKILNDTIALPENQGKSKEEIIEFYKSIGYNIPENLMTGSNEVTIPQGNVVPRPDGSAGRKWDREYGNTHNSDGTPKT